MSLRDGMQQATLASRAPQALDAAPTIDNTTWSVPLAPGALPVLLVGQTDAKQNGLYDVSRGPGGVVTWTRRLLTATDTQVTVALGSNGGIWKIAGTPVYGTDDIVISK